MLVAQRDWTLEYFSDYIYNFFHLVVISRDTNLISQTTRAGSRTSTKWKRKKTLKNCSACQLNDRSGSDGVLRVRKQ